MSEMTVDQLEQEIAQIPKECGVDIFDSLIFKDFKNILYGYKGDLCWDYAVYVPVRETTQEERIFLSITSGKTIKTPQEVYNDLVVEGVFKL